MIDYFLYKLKEHMNNNREKADKVIQGSVLWSMGAGLIPIPLADMVAVTAIQVDMLKQLSALYGHDFANAPFKAWLGSLSGSALSGAIKFIPGIGSIIGGVSMAAMAGASTYAVGQVFVEHFERGGTLQDFDVDQFREFYEKQFERGKAFVKDLQKEMEQRKAEEAAPSKTAADSAPAAKPGGASQAASPSSTASTPDIVARLKELSELRDKGIITDDEFKVLKEKLLREI